MSFSSFVLLLSFCDTDAPGGGGGLFAPAGQQFAGQPSVTLECSAEVSCNYADLLNRTLTAKAFADSDFLLTRTAVIRALL